MTDLHAGPAFSDYTPDGATPGVRSTFSALLAVVKDRKETLLGVMMMLMLAVVAATVINVFLGRGLSSFGLMGSAIVLLATAAVVCFCAFVVLTVTIQGVMRYHFREDTDFWQAFDMTKDRFWAIVGSGLMIGIVFAAMGWLGDFLLKVLVKIMPGILDVIVSLAWELAFGALLTALVTIYYPILIVEKKQVMPAFMTMFKRLGDWFWHFFVVFLVFHFCFKTLPSLLLGGLSWLGLKFNSQMLSDVSLTGIALMVLALGLGLVAFFLVGVKALLDAVLWHQSYQSDDPVSSDVDW